MKTKVITITAAFLFLVASAACRAEIIKIGFTGEVYYVGDTSNLLEGKISVGDSITGYYIYDSSTPDSDPQLSYGQYMYSTTPFGISLTVEGLTFQTDPLSVNFMISISDNPQGGSSESYTVGSSNNLFYNNDIYVQTIGLQLIDYSYTAISSTELTSFPPDLFAWQYSEILVYGGRGGTPPCFDEIFSIGGHITSFYLIPEPSTILLLGLGVIFVRRRRINQKT